MVAAASAWGLLIGGIASLSLGQALVRRLQHSGSVHLSTHFGTLLAASGALGALGGGITLALHFGMVNSAFGQLPGWTIVLLSLFIPVFVWEQFLTPLSGLAHTLSSLSRWQMFVRTAVAIGLFALAGLSYLHPASALVLLWTGQLAIGIAAAFAIWRSTRSIDISLGELRAILPAALMLHVTTVSALLLDTVTILLINEHLSRKDVGIYQLAQQMIVFMLIIPQTVAVILTARLSRLGLHDYWPQHRRVVMTTCMLMLSLAAAAYFFAPAVVHWMAGPQFDESAHLFRLMLPSLAGLTLSQLLAPQWIGRGLFVVNASLTVGAALLMYFATAYSIELWGVEGAALVRSAVFGGLVTLTQLGFFFWLEHRWRTNSVVTG